MSSSRPQPVRLTISREEFRFRHRRAGEADIGREVLDQDRPLDRLLRPLDIAADDRERLFVIGNRQEIVEIDAIADAPGEMLRHHRRLEAVAHCLEAGEMTVVDALAPSRATGRRRGSTACSGRGRAPARQSPDRHSCSFRHGPQASPPTDAAPGSPPYGGGADRCRHCAGGACGEVWSAWIVRSVWGWLEDRVQGDQALGSRLPLGELGAGAGGQVNPRIALVVGGRRAGAGMRRGLAVVGAGLRRRRSTSRRSIRAAPPGRHRRRRRGGERGHGGKRRADQKFGIDHRLTPLVVCGPTDGLARPV